VNKVQQEKELALLASILRSLPTIQSNSSSHSYSLVLRLLARDVSEPLAIRSLDGVTNHGNAGVNRRITTSKYVSDRH
jgi:hypothetical protein